MADKDRDVLDYEYNLKMHYEAKRKELDILLTSSMPHQLNNMKTLLWINFILVGIMLQFIKKFPLLDILIVSFFMSIVAIVIVLLAMLTNRYKEYGVPDDVLHMHQYNDSEWCISQATLDMIATVDDSIKKNRNVLNKRGNMMHLSTWFTLFAILFALLFFILKHIST